MTTDIARAVTVLFAPGVSPAKLGKALAGAADAVVLDLEDSVPVADKPEARRNVASALADSGPRRDQTRLVRINHEEVWDDADLELLRSLLDAAAIDGVMLPKVSSAAELDSFQESLGQHVDVWAVATETPEGVVRLVEICRHPLVRALCWGPEDLGVLMGSFGSRDDEGRLREVYRWVRWQALVAARGAGIEAYDTVFVDIGDPDRLAEEAREAASAGFTGKMAIHPGQLPVIEEAFTAPPDLVDWSRRLLAERAENGLGAFRFDGRMVDQPHFKLATRVLARLGEGAGVTT